MQPMKWYDLSLPIHDQMPVYPGDPTVSVIRELQHETHGLQLTRLMLGCHAGTHLDAPLHFVAGGASIESLPLSRFQASAWVISVPWRPGRPLDLTLADWSGYHPGDALLLATGWDKRFYTGQYYEDLPYFAAGSSALLKKHGIQLFGLDLPTVKELAVPGQVQDDADMHRQLLGQEIIIVESLTGLEPLVGRRIGFQALPLHLAGCEGSPVRAVAWDLEA